MGIRIRVIICLLDIKMYCLIWFSKHVENNILNARGKNDVYLSKIKK